MKTMILISFILPLLVFSQPIDYNNFDTKLAEKVLFEKLLYYRDTVKTFASGIKIVLRFCKIHKAPTAYLVPP